MKNLYIDFDGVVVNTIDVSYKMAEDLGVEKKYECYLEFYKTLDWSIVLDKCEAINDSWDAIKLLKESGKYNIAILTHVTSISEAEEKVKYIRKFLPDITIIPVPKSISKTMMLDVTDAILVDDYANNLEEWKNAGGTSIKFDLKLSGKGFKVIDNLADLLKL